MLFQESYKSTRAKYMHLYKNTRILKHLKSFIWIRYKIIFLEKS